MASALEPLPLSATLEFNWIFLVELLIIDILALFFLFYFNRLFATVVSFAIRAYTWRAYKAYIDIEALQISPLGGRIFFKSIRYHAHNVTVYVYEGHVTWRYWLRLVRQAEVFQQDEGQKDADEEEPPSSSSSREKEDSKEGSRTKPRKRNRSIGKEEKADGKPKKELPCRISVEVSGVEAFIYNRSPVYDAVVEATLGKTKKRSSARSDTKGQKPSASPHETPDGSSNSDGPPGNAPEAKRTETHTTVGSSAAIEKPKIPAFLRIFPIRIECKRAAAAIGNENTKNVITAKAERSAGTVDAGRAEPLDLWKLLFNFEIQNVVVAMKPNRDFKELQLDAGQRIIRQRETETDQPNRPVQQTLQSAQSLCSKIKAFFVRNKGSSDSLRTASIAEGKSFVGRPANQPLDQMQGRGQWHGLMRYLDEGDQDEHDEWQQVEYAKASELVNIPKVTFRFFWDMPGLVGDGTNDATTLLGSIYEDDINGAAPPEYGMELGVFGGFVVYGPWADRQRINLQPIFVPATYVDTTAAEPLQPGQLRVSTIFKIKVLVEEEVTLRIPTREESKDSRWKGRSNKPTATDNLANESSNGRNRHWRRHKPGFRRKGKKGPAASDARPYGWIDITVKKDSVVNYNMDMYPRSTGYCNTLDLDVKGLEMSSSVNHGLLWKSGSLTLDADLSQPAPWNSLRKWPFNIVINDMELFILRDHLFLIIDIVNDWASGAPSDFYTFVPYYYQIGLTFNNFVMYLNVNDANIINDPADFDRNDYLTIEGQLRATLDIPMENFRPKRNQISYDVIAHDLKMRMHSSAKSTLSTFVEDKTMADLPKLTLNGSYNGNQEAQVGNVDVLRFDIVGTGLTLKAFGFYVRQLVNLKENYFGDYMHFKTLEEFQEASDDLMEANAKTASFPKPTSINELDVILCIVAEDVTVLLPTNLYSCKDFMRIELPRADLDLRIVSYYLDMGLQLSPVSILTGSKADGDESPSVNESSTQLYCHHVELNGHRSFGLPPNEEAYVSQWDIDIGKITGEMSSQFVRDFALAGRAFAFSISDAENAAPLVSPAVVLDATFVQVKTGLIRLWMHVGHDAFLLDLQPVKVETSDWASSMFSQRVSVLAPLVTVACIDGRDASRHRTLKHNRLPVRTCAFLQTGVSLDVLGRKHNFEIETKRQQSHFKLHDRRTNRFPFLVRPDIDATLDPGDEKDFEAPAIPYPFPPQPMKSIEKADRDLYAKSLLSVGSVKQLRSKSSRSSLAGSMKSSRPVDTKERPDLVSRSTDKTESGTSASFHSLRSGSRATSPASDDYVSQGRLPNDVERAKLGLPSSTMAFSSPYSEPYFSLEMIRPDENNVPPFRTPGSVRESVSDTMSSISDLIRDPDVDQDLERVTIMIKVAPGIRGYIEPRVAMVASKLVEKILPKHPDEIMDAFQMSVMGEIENQHAVENANSKVIEIQTTIQSIQIRLVMLDNLDDKIVDQMDLQLRAVETSLRLKSEPSPSGVVPSMALHAILGGLELQVAKKQDKMNNAAVRLSIDDALVWLALTKANAFHVSFRETCLAIDGAQAKYLSQLALKLVPVINDIKTRFESILSNGRKRLELLTYVLTQNGEGSGDPPFMARLMYILRAFPQHFRNTDSWKILARFRWILKTLPPEALHDLQSRCKAATLNCPADAPHLVLESWNQWRNWDVPYVNQTAAFKMLFGAEDAKDMDPSDQKATTITFRSESLQVVIEYASNRSELLLEETSLGMENSPPTKPEGLMLVDENTRTKTVLQMHIGTIALLLDWGLFQIVEDVLSLKDEIQAVSAMLQNQGSRTAGQALEDGLARHDVHIALSTDTGSVTLKTVNLRHVGRSDGLKISLIGTTQATDQLGQCMSVILNADTTITELYGPTSRIWQSLLTSASLYVDSLHPKTGIDAPPTVTVATAYNKLQIVVSEQVPGILHIIDTTILDEVAKINHLVETAKSVQPAPRSPATAIVPRSTHSNSRSPKVHVAVLAGQLHFEVSLLSTLSYLLEGTAVSARVAPSLSDNSALSIDFDVGRQNHAFVNTSSDESHTQDLLELPPINGHVGLELGDDQTSISVATTIEKVEVDAGAIQGVVAVLSRPEVQEVMSAIKGGVKDIQHHVEEVFPEQHAPKPKTNTKRAIIAYDAKLAVLGVRVSASTPHFQGRSTAEVEFGIGPLHVKASNRETPGNVLPQVLANVQDIGASLKIKDRGRLRPCGNLTLGLTLQFSNHMEQGAITRELRIHNNGLELNIFPETAATVIDVINHLQDRIKHLDLSKEVDYLRRLRDQRKNTVIQRISGKNGWSEDQELPFSPEDLLSIKTTIELKDLQARWLVDPSFAARPESEIDDLVFSIANVEFTTRKGHEARLIIADMQLQLCKKDDPRTRSRNSALLPEISFSVGYWTRDDKRHLAFKATGKPLDLRLESTFMLPTNALQKSIELAMEKFKQGTATWDSTPTTSGAPRSTAVILDSKQLGSVLVEADFAGARVYMQGSGQREQTLAHLAAASQQKQGAQHGRYGQFAAEGALMETTLTAPGFAFKVEYNSHEHQPTLNGELNIEASSNMLLPNVVPLMMEVSNSVKEVMRNQKMDATPIIKVAVPEAAKETAKSTQKFFEEDNIVAVTPAKIFGKTKVDLGFRICKQEFALSCKPIARVDATASLEDLYITMNTIDSDEHGHFFAMSAVVTKLSAQVKHMYSRDPTFSYDMDSIVLSAMNNKHLSGTPGISAILNFNPTKIVINGKQFQDLLLFREIWLPPEIRNTTATASAKSPSASSRPDEFLVQKYQTVAAAAAFPWNATVSIKELEVDLDLGQSIGKSSFTITNLWAAQHKTSTWEQNLCIGMDEMAVHSTGRMSGFIELEKFGIRTSIHWPEKNSEDTMRKTPLIQASVGFNALRAKAAFDYQAFAFGDIGGFDFLMYNVRDSNGKSDRLVTVLDCEKAYVFCTSTSPAQAVGLYQAFDRLIQEKQAAYEQSLKDIEKHLRRESTVVPTRFGPQVPNLPVARKEGKKSSISLHTDVVVTMGAVSFGVFPSTFFDSQMLKLEANNIQARFAVGLEKGKITSGLGMTLGQLQVALSSVRRITAVPKALEITVDEVVSSALNSKGGIILRVPKVIASMQTWQSPDDNNVDYIFKSLFEGKIDVGWNLNRINFIKNMWTSHTRALASRLGKSLPESAVKITAGSQKDNESNEDQEKITAEINLPQSRYEYNALEAPVIETPQLRDMGEATPPLEWIGLHRDRLPNVTHQIIIVSLLEVCREVEDAYEKILGSS